MGLQETFDSLERDKLADARRHFISFLHDASLTLKSNERPPTTVAYEIAGMLSTQFARSLPKGDSLLEIMIIAGELEINPTNTKQLTQELIAKIELLDD